MRFSFLSGSLFQECLCMCCPAAAGLVVTSGLHREAAMASAEPPNLPKLLQAAVALQQQALQLQQQQAMQQQFSAPAGLEAPMDEGGDDDDSSDNEDSRPGAKAVNYKCKPRRKATQKPVVRIGKGKGTDFPHQEEGGWTGIQSVLLHF